MIPARLLPWAVAGVLVLLIAGVAGWSLGRSAAEGAEDARTARDAAYERGFELEFERSRATTAVRGYREGANRGRLAGKKTGGREGTVIGAGNAEIEQTVAAQKAAEAAASAAESEIAARQANCGVVAAAPSWCPTGDELAAYRSAVRAAREAAEEAEREKREQEKREEGERNGRA